MQLGSIGKLARLLLIAAPPLLIGWLIFRDGVDLPFGVFEKIATGTLRFADFFAQHNEHRILFPRLIFFGFGRLTQWNIRAELFVNWFVALVCLFNVWHMTWRSGWKDSGFWILFSSIVLLFSPLNRDNFLRGFQIGFLSPLPVSQRASGLQLMCGIPSISCSQSCCTPSAPFQSRAA